MGVRRKLKARLPRLSDGETHKECQFDSGRRNCKTIIYATVVEMVDATDSKSVGSSRASSSLAGSTKDAEQQSARKL